MSKSTAPDALFSDNHPTPPTSSASLHDDSFICLEPNVQWAKRSTWVVVESLPPGRSWAMTASRKIRDPLITTHTLKIRPLIDQSLPLKERIEEEQRDPLSLADITLLKKFLEDGEVVSRAGTTVEIASPFEIPRASAKSVCTHHFPSSQTPFTRRRDYIKEDPDIGYISAIPTSTDCLSDHASNIYEPDNLPPRFYKGNDGKYTYTFKKRGMTAEYLNYIKKRGRFYDQKDDTYIYDIELEHELSGEGIWGTDCPDPCQLFETSLFPTAVYVTREDLTEEERKSQKVCGVVFKQGMGPLDTHLPGYPIGKETEIYGIVEWYERVSGVAQKSEVDTESSADEDWVRVGAQDDW